MISIFSVTLVTLYGQTRILFAMGRDGMLPKRFAAGQPANADPDVQHHRGGHRRVAPAPASCRLDYLADVISIGTLGAFIVVAIGVIVLRTTEPDLPRGFKVPAATR